MIGMRLKALGTVSDTVGGAQVKGVVVKLSQSWPRCSMERKTAPVDRAAPSAPRARPPYGAANV